MENEKIKVPLPVVVEGKYDKIKLSGIIDAEIITTDGFGVFKSRKKTALIRRLSQNGIIILTDSDGAGKVIRGHLSGMISPDKIYNLYVPKVKGKEKRKKEGSREGTLGVEGIDAQVLRELFESFVKKTGLCRDGREPVTKADLYFARLSGCEGGGERRDAIAERLGLPPGLTAGAFLSAVNVIVDREEFLRLAEEMGEGEE